MPVFEIPSNGMQHVAICHFRIQSKGMVRCIAVFFWIWLCALRAISLIDELRYWHYSLHFVKVWRTALYALVHVWCTHSCAFIQFLVLGCRLICFHQGLAHLFVRVVDLIHGPLVRF